MALKEGEPHPGLQPRQGGREGQSHLRRRGCIPPQCDLVDRNLKRIVGNTDEHKEEMSLEAPLFRVPTFVT